jgi:tRNA U34 5-carboxymethylaminomethyl modifying enzyme MnmG/GidA
VLHFRSLWCAERAHKIIDHDAADARLMELAKTLGRNSRQRWEIRQRIRQQAKSDTQFDHDIEREENGERYL